MKKLSYYISFSPSTFPSTRHLLLFFWGKLETNPAFAWPIETAFFHLYELQHQTVNYNKPLTNREGLECQTQKWLMGLYCAVVCRWVGLMLMVVSRLVCARRVRNWPNWRATFSISSMVIERHGYEMMKSIEVRSVEARTTSKTHSMKTFDGEELIRDEGRLRGDGRSRWVRVITASAWVRRRETMTVGSKMI